MTHKLDKIEVGGDSGTEVTLTVDGEDYVAKVIEYDARVVIYYDKVFESEDLTEQGKIDELDGLLDDVGLSGTSKEVNYVAK